MLVHPVSIGCTYKDTSNRSFRFVDVKPNSFEGGCAGVPVLSGPLRLCLQLADQIFLECFACFLPFPFLEISNEGSYVA